MTSKLTNLKQITQVIMLLFFSISVLPFIPFKDQTNADSAGALPESQDREPARTTWVVATAYSSDVGQTDATPCIPASGYDLCKHYEEFGFGNTVAANFLPLGTQVRLPDSFGGKVFIVRDRMNERYGAGRIDIWMPTKEEARQFGVKYMKLEQFGGGYWRWQLARQ